MGNGGGGGGIAGAGGADDLPSPAAGAVIEEFGPAGIARLGEVDAGGLGEGVGIGGDIAGVGGISDLHGAHEGIAADGGAFVADNGDELPATRAGSAPVASVGKPPADSPGPLISWKVDRSLSEKLTALGA